MMWCAKCRGGGSRGARESMTPEAIAVAVLVDSDKNGECGRCNSHREMNISRGNTCHYHGTVSQSIYDLYTSGS